MSELIDVANSANMPLLPHHFSLLPCSSSDASQTQNVLHTTNAFTDACRTSKDSEHISVVDSERKWMQGNPSPSTSLVHTNLVEAKTGNALDSASSSEIGSSTLTAQTLLSLVSSQQCLAQVSPHKEEKPIVFIKGEEQTHRESSSTKRINAQDEATFNNINSNGFSMIKVHDTIRQWIHKGRDWLQATIADRERERDVFRTASYESRTTSGESLLCEDEVLNEVEQVVQDHQEDEDVFGHGFNFDDD